MKRLSSVRFMAFSVVLGLLSLLMMFVPLFKAGGTVYNATTGFFDSGSGIAGTNGAWPAFVGFMLILVSTAAVFIISLPIKISFGVEKLVLIGGSILDLIGLVLIMLITVEWCGINNWIMSPSNGAWLYPGSYLASFFALLAVCCNVQAYRLEK